MSSSSLLWVNKTLNSTSLSNSKNEQATARKIRSHAVTAGHKTSRVKRPLKRSSQDLARVERPDKIPETSLHPTPAQNLNPLDTHTDTDTSSHSSTTTSHPQNKLTINPLSTNLTPSSHAITLAPQTRSAIHYFTTTWIPTSFKLPGCIGSSCSPIPQSTITSLLQTILQDATSTYALLAASCARRAYLSPTPSAKENGRREAHCYAVTAMRGLRRSMNLNLNGGKGWDEDGVDGTAILFLAAYAVFCEDEGTAERHLSAVRRVSGGVVGNVWMERLQGNLEVLVVRSLGAWEERGEGMRGK